MVKILRQVFAAYLVAMLVFPVSALACHEEDDGDTGGYGSYGEYGPYGGYKNKSFDIEKKVRVEDEDEEWKDKVVRVAEDDVVQFRIRIWNTGEITTDDMKMHDYLPDEMYRVGGSGLTEYWDDFEPGEMVEFIIEAKVHSDEYDRENFEKCVVNKAVVEFQGHEEGSDTAIVCYEMAGEEIEELPSTGATATVAMAITGLGLVTLGFSAKKKEE
jgi:LPXTG-motif cell wall-anchored protein